MSFRVKIWSVYVHPLLKLNWLSLSLLFNCACFLVHRHSSKCILKHSKQANASWVLYSFLPPPFLFLQLAVITSEYQGQVLPQLSKALGIPDAVPWVTPLLSAQSGGCNALEGCPCVTLQIQGPMTSVGPLCSPQWLSVLILVAVLGTHVDQSFKCPNIDYQCSFQEFSTLPSSFSPEVLSFLVSLFNMINFWEMSHSDTFLTLSAWRCGAMWGCDLLCLSLTLQSTASEICLWKDLFRNTDEL